MKKYHAIFIALFLLVGLFVAWQMNSPTAGFLTAAVATAGTLTFKTNEKGELIMQKEDFLKAMDDVADRVAKELMEKYDLKKTDPLPGGGPKAEKENKEKDFSPKPNETKIGLAKRVQEAWIEVKGGRLALEKAPKEVKTFKYFEALRKGDIATVLALGAQSWEDAGMKALTEGSATDGGNLVPVEFATDLIYALEEYAAFKDCSYHQMASNELDLRSVTTKPIVYQVAEKTAPTEAGTKFGKPTLTAKAFAGMQVISNELSDDNNIATFYQDLIDLFAEAFNLRISYELFVGSSFTGIFGSSTPVTITLDSASIADITFKKIVAMSVALSPGKLGSNAKWYMHRYVWGFIVGMVDDQGRPIVQNPWDPMRRTLLGFPVVLDEGITNQGTVSSGGLSIADPTDAADTPYIAFGNLKWVHFGLRKAMTADILKEGTVAGVNLGEQRSKALVIDTRWGLTVTNPSNIAMLKTKA